MTRIPYSPILGEQSVRVRLGAETFVLRVRWQERTQRYLLDVLTQEQVPVVLGRHIETNGFPLRGVVRDDAPVGGVLVVLASSSTGTDPAAGELGGRVNLYWLPEDELQASLDRVAATIEAEG